MSGTEPARADHRANPALALLSGNGISKSFTFPYFDAMVRLYQDDEEFKKMVDGVKSSL